MLTPDNPYYGQVRLMVGVLPFVARERCFALKGGTAINLFVRDLPRLSVDIDLAYLPVGERAAALREIDAAFQRIKRSLEGVSPAYGAEVPVLSFEDLYAGKIVAALDRQHAFAATAGIQHHAAVGPVDMSRRFAPRREPEGTGELEVVEPVAGPRERGEQPQSHQAAPPVPVQGIPPRDDRVALLPRPEPRGWGRPERAAAPRGSLRARLRLASRRLPTCHLDQSSSALAPLPVPYTASGASR